MSHDDVLARLLDRHGRTYADEAGLRLRDTPAPLFGLLVLAHLLSANLSADLGVRAARAMTRQYRTAEAMAAASDDDRHAVLSEARFLRKRRTAELLGRTAALVVDDYDGDLRRLRDTSDGTATGVADLVTAMPGIGEVGAAIFCREAQAVWPGLRPCCDDRMADAARDLHLPHTARGLADATGDDDLSVLGAALVRCAIAGDAEEIRTGRSR
ncbi:endonuclease [Nocardioides lentus]|uniref:Endonuclease n=1 Tax=Nocardioides lentus TaxID=338077 RepID=A0ABP5AG37_9ACTN